MLDRDVMALVVKKKVGLLKLFGVNYETQLTVSSSEDHFFASYSSGKVILTCMVPAASAKEAKSLLLQMRPGVKITSTKMLAKLL